MKPKYILNVIWKALLLFLVLCFSFGLWNKVLGWEHWSVYGWLIPGRERFPFGENADTAYTLTIEDLDILFGTHEIREPKAENEMRIAIVGDSSVWGTLLTPEQTLAGVLTQSENLSCGTQKIRFYNLGYPTLSVTKDRMIMYELDAYHVDAVVWLITLEGIAENGDNPIVQSNPDKIILDDTNSQIEHFSSPFWVDNLIVNRKKIASWAKLQLYGFMWAATGVDQVYPETYTSAKHDLEAVQIYHGLNPTDGLDSLNWEAVTNGIDQSLVPILVVNEPVMISSGINSDLRYNFYYPRWAYDQYRSKMETMAGQNGWYYTDAWDWISEEEFTNTAIHLNPEGEARLAEKLLPVILESLCP